FEPLESFFSLSPKSFISIDKTIGGSIMGLNLFIVFQFRQDFFGQNLSQFHTPLIKAVNIPYHPLGEYFMLIHSHQGSKGKWIKLLYQNGICRPVSFKNLMRGQPLDFLLWSSFLVHFCFYLLQGF